MYYIECGQIFDKSFQQTQIIIFWFMCLFFNQQGRVYKRDSL